MSDAAAVRHGAVVELRRYTLHPGGRDTLIELFEREFVEPQEAAGATLIGQFRDRDDAERFVWLRGFADMASRHRALEAFYGGAIWKAHRHVANATMMDSDDVLLLRPLGEGDGFDLDGLVRPPQGSGDDGAADLVAVILALREAPGDDIAGIVDAAFGDVFANAGATTLARLATESAPNTFRALPVREGESHVVQFLAFDDRRAAAGIAAAIAHAAREGTPAARALRDRLRFYPDVRRLAPTPRSLLRG